GLEVDLQERGTSEGLDRVVMGDRGLPVGDDSEAPRTRWVPSDRRIDRPAEWVRMPLDERVVNLLDFPVVELPLQLGVRRLARGDDHEPGGVRIESVHDP